MVQTNSNAMNLSKRTAFARETITLPLLTGFTKAEVELGTVTRNEILEFVFDQFILPDEASTADPSSGTRKRARKLWKTLVSEGRASYFVELKGSQYIEWIKTGEPSVLPCTTSQVEERNRNLPELQGTEITVDQAKVIRATFLKFADELFENLLRIGAPAESRRRLLNFRNQILRQGTDADWFLRNQPKDFRDYEKAVIDLMKE